MTGAFTIFNPRTKKQVSSLS